MFGQSDAPEGQPTHVTKTFLPPFDEYAAIIKRAWDKAWITNNGELVLELEERLKEYLQVKHLLFCSNGTMALQLALRSLDVTGEVITTPFSYVATTNAILWEHCTPVFVDIRADTFCIDPGKIETAITSRTTAILATHVYGHPCDIRAIAEIASRRHLRVIYDGAHAFGSKFEMESVLAPGDISTCSFHATKLFHTGEGGCVITNDDGLARKLLLYRQFGHLGDEHQTIGVNAKNSELHAAMGLANLKYLDAVMESRRTQWLRYEGLLSNAAVRLLSCASGVSFNYAYFPVVLASEKALKSVLLGLSAARVFPRRYFYPSLNTLPYLSGESCPISESIASRVLCLPLFFGLAPVLQDEIAEILLLAIKTAV